MKFLILCLLSVTWAGTGDNGSFDFNTPPQPCGVNEVWTSCSSSSCFEKNCTSKMPDLCTRDCKKGCKCADGYARYHGQCVPTNTCPQGPWTCSDKEEWTECTSTSCFESQCNIRPADVCTMDCKRGCKCIPGFARYLNMCVNETMCPPLSLPPSSSPRDTVLPLPPSATRPTNNPFLGAPTPCPQNETFTTSSSSSCFEHICGVKPTNVCTKDCKRGCKCMDGFARLGSRCVNETTCPTPRALDVSPRPSLPVSSPSSLPPTKRTKKSSAPSLSSLPPSHRPVPSFATIINNINDNGGTFATFVESFKFLTGELAALAQMDFEGNRTLYVAARKENCTKMTGQCLLTRYDERVPFEPSVPSIKGFTFEPGYMFTLFVNARRDAAKDRMAYSLIRVVSKAPAQRVKVAGKAGGY